MNRDWLSPQEVSTLTPAVLRQRTAALKPALAEHAREAERIRRPVDAVWQEIRRSGVFYHFVPKRFGGLELDAECFVDIMLPLAEGCASTGWVTAFCVEHNWIMALFPEAAQCEIFGAFPYIVAPGVTSPPGRLVKCEGGYRLTGRWQWGTGVMHADWALLAAVIPDTGEPTLYFCAVPIADVAVLDTWHVDGMVGTGSNDIKVDDVFVPEHRLLDVTAMRQGRSPGATLHANPIYRMPMLPFLALTAVIPALGNARSAVDQFRRRIAERTVFGTALKQAEKPAASMRLAQADIHVRVAELVIRDAAREIMEMAECGDAGNTPRRVAVRARIAYAMELCRSAVRTVCAGSGASAHHLDNPLQRALRDAEVMASHIVYDLDAAMELHGRILSGLPPNSPLT